MNPLLYIGLAIVLQHMDGAPPPPIVEPTPIVFRESYTYDTIYTRCVVPPAPQFNPNTYQRPQGSNMLFPSTILPCDPTDFVEIVFEDDDIYHTFTAYFTNSDPITIGVDLSFSKEEAIYHALDYGKVIGQLPPLIRLNVELLTIRPGNGHPFSGEHTNTYVGLPLNTQGVKEENLVHDFAHASLNGRNGVINEQEWKEAMALDNFYPSIYAEHHHSGNGDPYIEDVPETMTIYLAIRLRPERFDPAVVDFYNARLYHRFKILDQFVWYS